MILLLAGILLKAVKVATTNSLTTHYAMQDVLALTLVVQHVSTAREAMNARDATLTTLDAPSAIQAVSHVSEDASVYAMHVWYATATVMAAMEVVKEHRPAYPAIQVRVVFLDVKVTLQLAVQDAMMIIHTVGKVIHPPAIKVRLNMGVHPATLGVRMKMFVQVTRLVLNAFHAMQVIPV